MTELVSRVLYAHSAAIIYLRRELPHGLSLAALPPRKRRAAVGLCPKIKVLSFSGAVNINNVNSAVDTTSIPIVELSIENPYDDFLQSKSQLEEFLTAYRKTKSKLLALGAKKIHLFAAIPVSFAIGIGQIYNPNYDASLISYDYKQGIYIKALTIGENT